MLRIDENECIGCGVCVSVCPAGFELVEDKARVTDEAARCVDEALSACPQGAIVRLAQGEVAAPPPRPVAAPLVPAPAVQGPVGTSRGGRPRFGRGQGRGRQRGGGRGRGRR